MAKFHSVADQPLEEESYFVSMTDMMVGLLFIFILMLMYFALQYQNKNEQLENANQTRGEILAKIQDNLKDQGFKVEIDSSSGVLRLNENVLQFARADATVAAKYHNVIVALANALGDVLPCYSNEQAYQANKCTDNPARHWLEAVFIEGHTDSVPIYTAQFPSNWELSTARAANTYKEITKIRPEIESLNNGEGHSLLSVSGYGDKRPVPESSANDTPDHRQMNRRIELRIIMATPKGESEPAPAVINSLKEKIE